MSKTKIFVAITAIVFAGAVEAGVYCKNDKGQTYEWHIGSPRPLVSDELKASGFDYGQDRKVVCFVNSETYRSSINKMNVPYVSGIPDANTATREGSGVLYRGDNARFIIDNLPSVYGDYTTKAFYNSLRP